MSKKKFFLALLLTTSTVVAAYDSGPSVVGCDYKFGKKEDTDSCLIVGAGTQMDETHIMFKVKQTYYIWRDTHPKVLEKVTKDGNLIQNLSITNSQEQCRPGGRNADKYEFRNGDYICLYNLE